MEDMKRARETLVIKFTSASLHERSATILVVNAQRFVYNGTWFLGLLTYKELSPEANSVADRVSEKLYEYEERGPVKLILTGTEDLNNSLISEIKDKIRARYTTAQRAEEWILCFNRDDKLLSFVKDLAIRASESRMDNFDVKTLYQ